MEYDIIRVKTDSYVHQLNILSNMLDKLYFSLRKRWVLYENELRLVPDNSHLAQTEYEQSAYGYLCCLFQHFIRQDRVDIVNWDWNKLLKMTKGIKQTLWCYLIEKDYHPPVTIDSIIKELEKKLLIDKIKARQEFLSHCKWYHTDCSQVVLQLSRDAELVDNPYLSLEQFIYPWQLVHGYILYFSLHQLLDAMLYVLDMLAELYTNLLSSSDLYYIEDISLSILDVLNYFLFDSPYIIPIMEERPLIEGILESGSSLPACQKKYQEYQRKYQSIEPHIPSPRRIITEHTIREIHWSKYITRIKEEKQEEGWFNAMRRAVHVFSHDLQVISAYYFMKITPEDMISKSSQNIRDMVEIFDKLNLHVVATILSNSIKNFSTALKLYRFYLRLAYECAEKRDYHSSLAIFLSLTYSEYLSQALSKKNYDLLTSCRKAINHKEELAMIDYLDNLFSMKGNFRTLMQEIKDNIEEGCIPFIGTYTKEVLVCREYFRKYKQEYIQQVQHISTMSHPLREIHRMQYCLDNNFRVCTDLHESLSSITHNDIVAYHLSSFAQSIRREKIKHKKKRLLTLRRRKKC
jgi:hypothetical protein